MKSRTNKTAKKRRVVHGTEIHVTKEDINKGIPRECTSCPIALAIKRKLNMARGVVVSADVVCILNMEYLLPRSAVHFIMDFDNGKAVRPFTFELGMS